MERTQPQPDLTVTFTTRRLYASALETFLRKEAFHAGVTLTTQKIKHWLEIDFLIGVYGTEQAVLDFHNRVEPTLTAAQYHRVQL